MTAPRRRKDRFVNAFTLIEVLAVVAIMAVVLGAVGLTLKYTLAGATDRDVLDRIRLLDADTRALARRAGVPMKLVYDLDRHRVRQQDSEGRDTGTTVTFPKGVKLIRLATVETPDQQYGSATIDIQTKGYSATYAVTCGRDGQPATTMLFAGLTGQATIVEEQAVESIFELLNETKAIGDTGPADRHTNPAP